MKLWKFASAATALILSAGTNAASIEFDFTGRLVIAGPDEIIIGPAYLPIEAALTYDTISGIGNSDLIVSMGDSYTGSALTFHDITLERQQQSNLISGQGLVDFDGLSNISFHVEWDGTGLFKAIEHGLQLGDVLSGSTLYHDANGNGEQDLGEFIKDISSATPYSDSLQRFTTDLQGPAPMAATNASRGISEGLYTGVVGYFDIGSGNSMHVTSVSAVPIPSAVWLFGSGLLGLIGVARSKKA